MNRDERIKLVEESERFASIGGNKREKTEKEIMIDDLFIEGKISEEEWKDRLMKIVKG